MRRVCLSGSGLPLPIKYQLFTAYSEFFSKLIPLVRLLTQYLHSEVCETLETCASKTELLTAHVRSQADSLQLSMIVYPAAAARTQESLDFSFPVCV